MMLPAFFALIQEAPATTTQAPATTGGGGIFDSIGPIVPLVAVFAIFYFVMIGPERKQRKKREAMLKQLKKGDKVMTSGGMYGSVAAIDGDRVTLQIDDGVRARFSRAAIQEVLPDDSPAPSSKS